MDISRPLYCSGCGHQVEVQVCTGCLCAFYCSRNCQLKHWPEHKELCKDIQRRKAAGVTVDINSIIQQHQHSLHQQYLLLVQQQQQSLENEEQPTTQPISLHQQPLPIPNSNSSPTSAQMQLPPPPQSPQAQPQPPLPHHPQHAPPQPTSQSPTQQPLLQQEHNEADIPAQSNKFGFMKNFQDMHVSDRAKKTFDSLKGGTAIAGNMIGKGLKATSNSVHQMANSLPAKRKDHPDPPVATGPPGIVVEDEAAIVNTKVFGVPLPVVLSRSAQSCPDLPELVYRCITMIRVRGLQEEGVFRQSGALREIKELRAAFNRGEVPDLSKASDVHVITGLLKLWLRELPEPLFISSGERHNYPYNPNITAPLAPTYATLRSICPHNLKVIHALMELLAQVVEHADINLMSAHNLSIVFSPSLQCPVDFFDDLLTNFSVIWTGLPCPDYSSTPTPTTPVATPPPASPVTTPTTPVTTPPSTPATTLSASANSIPFPTPTTTIKQVRAPSKPLPMCPQPQHQPPLPPQRPPPQALLQPPEAPEKTPPPLPEKSPKFRNSAPPTQTQDLLDFGSEPSSSPTQSLSTSNLQITEPDVSLTTESSTDSTTLSSVGDSLI
ncbi:rho GTPase activating protein [Pelomyxa schiedti]|nr:rho GTPase activating protein [Pelomyxa schiedti]